jgi:glycosyltransferase involved in cell wall biosynthesis
MRVEQEAPEMKETFNGSSLVCERRIALLTHYAPYRVSLFRELELRCRRLDVLVPAWKEPNRPWAVESHGLNMGFQRSFTVRQTCGHPQGFRESLSVPVPYDTVWRLLSARPDVIISGELGLRTLQALVYARLIPRTPCVVWATLSDHSELGRGRFRRLFRHTVLPLADAVLVNGAGGERYIRSFGVPTNKIFRVPYTVDTRLFAKVPLSRESAASRRLLFSGQLIVRKGLLPLLSALNQWTSEHPERPVELWIVGDGPERRTVEGRALSRGLTVRLVGNVPYRELPQYYARCGILAFPTLADEWGVVVNEAMTSGMPVLGSVYSQAVEELVEDGVTGWTFRPDRREEMYRAIDRALTVPEGRLLRMRACARHRAMALTPGFAADAIMRAVEFADFACMAAPIRKDKYEA